MGVGALIDCEGQIWIGIECARSAVPLGAVIAEQGTEHGLFNPVLGGVCGRIVA